MSHTQPDHLESKTAIDSDLIQWCCGYVAGQAERIAAEGLIEHSVLPADRDYMRFSSLRMTDYEELVIVFDLDGQAQFELLIPDTNWQWISKEDANGNLFLSENPHDVAQEIEGMEGDDEPPESTAKSTTGGPYRRHRNNIVDFPGAQPYRRHLKH